MSKTSTKKAAAKEPDVDITINAQAAGQAESTQETETITAKETEQPAAKEPDVASAVPGKRVVLCKVIPLSLDLPHGKAAQGKHVHLSESDFNYHDKKGNVAFIKYIDDHE